MQEKIFLVMQLLKKIFFNSLTKYIPWIYSIYGKEIQ